MKKITFTIFIICISCKGNAQKDKNKQDNFPIKKTEVEWKKELSQKAYYVLRAKGTEYAYTGKYYNNNNKGNYVCAGCGAFLYSSNHKYDSNCGWPSFDKGNNKNLGYRPDNSHGMKRIEVYCKQCGGHLGHLFNDGPIETTGKRHCINSVSLRFIAKK